MDIRRINYVLLSLPFNKEYITGPVQKLLFITDTRYARVLHLNDIGHLDNIVSLNHPLRNSHHFLTTMAEGDLSIESRI
jgi:hypothetical protein